jgi:hypothetical protein
VRYAVNATWQLQPRKPASLPRCWREVSPELPSWIAIVLSVNKGVGHQRTWQVYRRYPFC